MSQYVETPCRTFTAGTAITQHARVYLSGGKLAVAGITVHEIGTAEQAAFADGDVIDVRLRTCQGTVKMIAADAITSGADVYTAATGMVDDAHPATAYLLGTALEAASGANSVIEVLRHVNTGAAESS